MTLAPPDFPLPFYNSSSKLSADWSLRFQAMASFTSVKAFLSSFIKSRDESILWLPSSGKMRKFPARDFRTTCSPAFAKFRYFVWLVRKSLVLITTIILYICLRCKESATVSSAKIRFFIETTIKMVTKLTLFGYQISFTRGNGYGSSIWVIIGIFIIAILNDKLDWNPDLMTADFIIFCENSYRDEQNI